MDIQPKQFHFYGVHGLSENQLKQHEKLYDNYVNKLNEVRRILEDEVSFENSNTTFSRMRSLKLAESYSLNGVKLHELYFENITGMRRKPINQVMNAIIKNFGSYEVFLARLIDVGLAMRGWAILVWDNIDGKLHIIGQDEHDVGSTIGTVPLLVMDVYEHAYMIDFGINRRAYIDVFIRNINWDVVNERYLKLEDLLDE